MKHLLVILLGLCLLSATALASNGASAPGLTMTHRMMMLVIQLGLILIAAKLANILFEKIKLPGALGGRG